MNVDNDFKIKMLNLEIMKVKARVESIEFIAKQRIRFMPWRKKVLKKEIRKAKSEAKIEIAALTKQIEKLKDENKRNINGF